MPGTETGGSLKSNVEQYPIRRSFATNMKFSIFTKHNKTLKEIKKKKAYDFMNTIIEKLSTLQPCYAPKINSNEDQQIYH